MLNVKNKKMKWMIYIILFTIMDWRGVYPQNQCLLKPTLILSS